MKETEWIDISQPLSNNIGHWPGDTPFQYETAFTKKETGSVNIGKIVTSLHTGTHVDAPFHFDDDGERIIDLDINIFIGRARIIDVSAFKEINVATLSQFDLSGVTRLLLKTAVPNQPHTFPEQIIHLDAQIAPYLQASGVKLIGVDVPSIDPLNSKEMPAHHAFHHHRIHILENIMIDTVEPGDYDLIALPLPLIEGDGSPVRAVLRRCSEKGR
ncbi:arylformamidase [Cytobacillus horneckiae]|uniref:Kynurenine formamidase n=1 Tax=Cytobacillus horneckiae TaxID=549687 RepID=A0A2N0ZGF3_9BACI|nr:arylformamidase [Cytobacillus horneckiae]MBN6888238.1 arylformamidase [Cytobacillus horneckiae]MCM3177094.1 arylformamidase [Cytobacillus horneckiae]MEC1154793.1 arylformamidase [Cytobacillus horneckiae]MED2940287.1 arylformamidase [Cytobacillus horneckiae]PKG28587.1 arylformamidase [Cytobacillus horneckiae]